jgi:hypothetical protein
MISPPPHPGQQLGQGERLGQVVPGAALQAVDLGGHVGHARQHHHVLVRAGAQQLVQDAAAIHVRHHQVQDDQVVVPVQRVAQGFRATPGKAG